MVVIEATTWMQAALSGLLAGAVAIAVTVAIEKLGGTWGGIIASMPVTNVAFTLGLGLANMDSREETVPAMFAVPLGMTLNVIVLLIWRYGMTRLWPYAVHDRSPSPHQRIAPLSTSDLDICSQIDINVIQYFRHVDNTSANLRHSHSSALYANSSHNQSPQHPHFSQPQWVYQVLF